MLKQPDLPFCLATRLLGSCHAAPPSNGLYISAAALPFLIFRTYPALSQCPASPPPSAGSQAWHGPQPGLWRPWKPAAGSAGCPAPRRRWRPSACRVGGCWCAPLAGAVSQRKRGTAPLMESWTPRWECSLKGKLAGRGAEGGGRIAVACACALWRRCIGRCQKGAKLSGASCLLPVSAPVHWEPWCLHVMPLSIRTCLCMGSLCLHTHGGKAVQPANHRSSRRCCKLASHNAAHAARAARAVPPSAGAGGANLPEPGQGGGEAAGEGDGGPGGHPRKLVGGWVLWWVGGWVGRWWVAGWVIGWVVGPTVTRVGE